MRALAYSLLLIGSVMVIGVAWSFAPEDTSVSYWLGVLWLEILLLVNWYTSTVIFGGAEGQKSNAGNLLGVMPAISISVFVYSLVSGSSLVIYHLGTIGAGLHALIQLLSFGIVAVIVVLAVLAYRGAIAGTLVAVTQKELVEELNRLKRGAHANEGAVNLLDEMYNYCLYSLPAPASANQELLKSVWQDLQDCDAGLVTTEELATIFSRLKSV